MLPAPRENFSIKGKIPKRQHSPVRKTAVSSILDEQNFHSSLLGLLDTYTPINPDLEVLETQAARGMLAHFPT